MKKSKLAFQATEIRQLMAILDLTLTSMVNGQKCSFDSLVGMSAGIVIATARLAHEFPDMVTPSGREQKK